MNMDILWVCENCEGGFNVRFRKKKTSFDTLKEVIHYAKVKKFTVIWKEN